MSQKRRVLLCGKSLFISGLQVILESAPGLDLQQVTQQPDQIRERITMWEPDVLVLESELMQTAFPLSLLHDFPQLKLIGLDIEENRLQVISGSTADEPTADRLLQVIGA